MNTLFDKIVITTFDAKEASAITKHFGMTLFEDECFAEFPVKTYVHIASKFKLYLVHITVNPSSVVSMVGLWEILKTLRPQAWLVVGDFLGDKPSQMCELVISAEQTRDLIAKSRCLMDIHDLSQLADIPTIVVHQNQAMSESLTYISHFIEQYMQMLSNEQPRKTYRFLSRIRSSIQLS